MPRNITRYALRVLQSDSYQPIDLVEIRPAGANPTSVIRITNAAETITWGGHTWVPINFSRSEMSEILSTQSGQEPNITVTFANIDRQAANLVSTTEIAGAKLKLWLHDRRRIIEKPERTRDAILLVDGEVKNPSLADGVMTFDVVSVLGMIDPINIPRRSYGTTCSHTYLSAACGATGGKIETTILAHSNKYYLVVDDATLATAGDDPTEYWKNGYIAMVDGAQALHGRPISRVATVGSQNRIYLRFPLRVDPETGDSVVIVRGCGKTKQDCIDRQGDANNFGGFEEIPADIKPVVIQGY